MSVLNPGVRVVRISGSSLAVGATTFELDGRMLYGLADDRPDAAAAHAALKWAYYHATDTQVTTQTDGTNWQAV